MQEQGSSNKKTFRRIPRMPKELVSAAQVQYEKKRAPEVDDLNMGEG